MNYAVIDLGSNTVRLSVYRYENDRIITVIRQKEVAGLAGYVTKNTMELEGIHKACDILRELKEIASGFVKEENIHIFATASLRGLLNQDQALEMIRLATGMTPEVLSGEEEARLGFVGASYFTECQEGVLIDIGGASTEFVRFENSQPVQLASMPLGCLSLYTRFVEKVIPTDQERKKIKKEIRGQLDAAGFNPESGFSFPLMIGIGGTARAAHKLSCELFSLPKDQYEIKSEYVKKILYELRHNENKIYRTIYKLIPERVLTISAGLMILNQAVRLFDCDSIFVSGYGVREGYLIDRVIKGVNITRARGACGYGDMYA